MRGERNVSKARIIVFSIIGLIAIAIIGWNTVLTESISKPLSEDDDLNCFDFEIPDSNISRAIYLNLKSAIAIDNQSREVLYCYNAQDVRPVASISKLLMAMVVLDEYNPDTLITISRKDSYKSRRSVFRVGDKVRARDLLHAALLQSDNRAARALARTVAGSIPEFVKKMNEKAVRLGLQDTRMYEPTGLNERNQSTAADCARLVNDIIELYPEIARISSLKKYVFRPVNRRRSKRLINTNKMVFSKYRVLAGKTGYIIESDYCLATVLENGEGKQATIVILGAPGPNTRFREARRLANYAFRKIG
jgi:D-alanyl-D-alanine endopeptidase (penicillin-binding protein 7)